jgi:N-acetylglucosaminyldiphosphoundecaprenol N-acetyl-beta-D-mannosaminyltransferase
MLGLQVCTATACDVASSLMQWTREPMHGRYFVCMNPHSFESARRLDAFRVAAEDADLLIPDGIGVVLASRLSGGSILERVCGPDVFRLLSQQLDAEKGKRVFFLGGRPDVLDRVVSRYRREYPGVDVAGAYSPPFSTSFSTSQNADMVALVNDHSPDILWVGLGSPKQEIWTRENANALKAKVIAPIGAAFDFYAGSIKPPPVWMQRSGLQWFHRLTQEPGRLWRRNLDSPLFLARVLWVNWFARLAGGSI